jgi:hypothetical protein
LFHAKNLSLCRHNCGPSADAETLDQVKVLGVQQRLEQTGRLADSIEQTEVIDRAQIERRNADTLTQAIDKAGRRAMDGAQNLTRKCLIFGGRS